MSSAKTTVFLRVGYVESRSNAACILTSHKVFETKAAALQDLADSLVECMQYDLDDIWLKDCCELATTAYCSACGKKIPTSVITFNDVTNTVHNLLFGTCDTLGGEAWQILWDAGWQLDRLPGGEFINVYEYGDKVIASLIEGVEFHKPYDSWTIDMYFDNSAFT